MASRVAENVACVQIFGTLAGQETMNDFYYHQDSQPSHTDMVTLIASLSDVVEENWLAGLNSNWVGRSIFAYDMTVPDGANAVDDAISVLTGTSPGDPLPNNVTLALARKNGLRGRAGNGRIFWQGLNTSGLEDVNTVSILAASFFIEAVEALDAAAVLLGWDPVILSFQKDGVVSIAATRYPLVNWVITDRTIDSRRRRLPRRGA